MVGELVVDADSVGALHQRLLAELATPGDWWDAAARRALMEEARAALGCLRCADGVRHDSTSTLPAAAIEVVHRVVNESGRLTRAWAIRQIDELGDARYAEIVGVTATIVAIDVAARAVGDVPPALADPVDGPPAGLRPERRRPGRRVDPDDRGEAARQRDARPVAGAAHERHLAVARHRVLQPGSADARADVAAGAHATRRQS